MYERCFDMSKKNNYSKYIFLKSMIFTAAAIALIVIGYFSAEFFFTKF